MVLTPRQRSILDDLVVRNEKRTDRNKVLAFLFSPEEVEIAKGLQALGLVTVIVDDHHEGSTVHAVYPRHLPPHPAPCGFRWTYDHKAIETGDWYYTNYTHQRKLVQADRPFSLGHKYYTLEKAA